MDENDNFPVREITDEPHALYAITRYLDALQLSDWCKVLILWLGQYDGLEPYLDIAEKPTIALRDLLARYIATGRRISHMTFATDLANLPFLQYRVRLLDTSGPHWNPKETSFIEFANGRDVAVWSSDYPTPELDTTKEHFLALFMSEKIAGR